MNPIKKLFVQIWDSGSAVAWRYHMEVFHLEILGFPETEASEDLLQAQPEAHFGILMLEGMERATNLCDFQLISSGWWSLFPRWQLCSTLAGNLGGIAAAKFATIVAGSTNQMIQTLEGS